MRITLSDSFTSHTFAADGLNRISMADVRRGIIHQFNLEYASDLVLANPLSVPQQEGVYEPQIVYRVVDDGTCVLTTLDELKALRKLESIVEKTKELNSWTWIDREEPG